MKFSAQRIRESFLRIWKDPVWSKVIATAIIAIAGLIWARVTNHTWEQIYLYLLQVLAFKVPLSFVLSAIALYFIVLRIVSVIRNRKDPFWDEQIGNYTFKELYNIMLLEKWDVPTRGMSIWGQKAPEDDLLTLFCIYYSILTKGVDFYYNVGDGHYLYGSLAPKFVGYGLVDAYDKEDENLPGKTNIAYKTSELGHRFHSKLDKIGLKDRVREEKRKRRRQ